MVSWPVGGRMRWSGGLEWSCALIDHFSTLESLPTW